jgi:hypothetical protein
MLHSNCHRRSPFVRAYQRLLQGRDGCLLVECDAVNRQDAVAGKDAFAAVRRVA